MMKKKKKEEEAGKKKENRRGGQDKEEKKVRGNGVKSKRGETLKESKADKRASHLVCVCVRPNIDVV